MHIVMGPPRHSTPEEHAHRCSVGWSPAVYLSRKFDARRRGGSAAPAVTPLPDDSFGMHAHGLQSTGHIVCMSVVPADFRPRRCC